MNGPIPATELYNPEAKRVLDLMDRTEGGIAPGDVVDEIPSVNHRYARELIGLLTTGGLAVLDESGDDDVWRITEPGHTLAESNRRMVNSTSAGRRGRPTTTTKEHQMPNAATKAAKNTAAKAASKPAVRKPSEPHPCACGCGTTLTTKSTFAQGHDARMVSQLVAAVVGGNAKAKAVVPEALSAVENDILSGEDIQWRIDLAAKETTLKFGEKLGNKAHSALMNGWARYDKPAKAAKAAPAQVQAKVGRWTKTGHVDSKGQFVTKDAKGNKQVVAKGKFEVIETGATA